jgi:hypothetical protein
VKVRIPGSCSGALGFSATALLVSLSVMGCASAPPAPVLAAPAKALPSPQPPSAIRAASASASTPREDEEQREAQHAWCKYLEALYLRATDGAHTWPRLAQCEVVRTPAAPAMLQRTAACSMAALQKFEGDPFTPAYAAEVTRCGRDSLEAAAMRSAELTPFVQVICARAVACGTSSEIECTDAVVAQLGMSLRRAIGAVNERGRAELRACLASAACEETSAQITACLTPIMDRLLWLPEQSE